MHVPLTTIELSRDKTNRVICTPHEDSDKTGD